MATPGIFKAVWKMVTKKVLGKGGSFNKARSIFNKFSRTGNKKKQFKIFREAREYQRLKPFIKLIKPQLRIPDFFKVTTETIITKKFQYVFEASFNYKGDGQKDTATYSLLSDYELTKEQATDAMFTKLASKELSTSSRAFRDLSLELTGVRVAPWQQ